MFTGLVEILGTVTSMKNAGNGIRLSLRPSSAFEQKPGDSISVNGVCLTVTKNDGDIAFDVSPETMRSTNLGEEEFIFHIIKDVLAFCDHARPVDDMTLMYVRRTKPETGSQQPESHVVSG